ncbi:MBG domain-containing protein, partial [Pontibacter sp. H259]|uniref:MBG domain-containing protein n=1 Tax=Pontibacter sp. H259 TaxID=3133421 RepID=UPI0030BDC0E8
LTVTATNTNKYAGQVNPSFYVSYQGFVNSETSEVLGGNLIYSTIATVNSCAGIYDIIPSGFISSNYEITYNKGQLTIHGVVIDASVSSNPVRFGTDATLTATVTPAVAGVSVTFKLDSSEKGTALTDSNGKVTLIVSGLPVNVYQVEAIAGSSCATSTAYLPVYDPNGGFVTGGGWINSPPGALAGDQNKDVTGKANFGFVSKYKKGSSQVDGNTEFQFQAGNLNFKSTLHGSGSLVIAGGKATYRGDGTVNGISGYKFTLTAIDGNWDNGTSSDKFRIKIWGANGVIYDNQMDKADNTNDATILGGGSIVIHEVKSTSKSSTLVTKAPAEPEEAGQFYNYPNTFTDRTTIAFSLEKSESYLLEVYDMRGVLIKKVDMGVAEAGKLYEFEFNGSHLSKGMYIARLLTPSGAKSVKMILNK